MPTTYYIWDEVNDTLLMEKDEAGNTTAAYTYEPGQYGPLISQRRGGQTSYYHFDGQGSTRQLTDANQNVTDSAVYTAFGEPVASSGTTTNPFGYKGALGYYVNPDTNDLYVRGRNCFPPMGRWLSLRLSKSALAVEMHVYARNASPTLIDPRGLLADLFQQNTIGDAYRSGDKPRIGKAAFGPFDCAKLEADVLAAAAAAFTTSMDPKCWPFSSLTGSMPHRHCTWNCHMTLWIGEEFAKKCSLGKELADIKICDIADLLVPDACWSDFTDTTKKFFAGSCCSAWQSSDFQDNAIGRLCGKCWGNLKIPFACKACCNALGAGPDAKEGPGTTRPYGPRCSPRYLVIQIGNTPK